MSITATINGITFTGLTVSDVREIANLHARPVVSEASHIKAAEQVVEKAIEKRESKPQHVAGTHKYDCGHVLPASRGRYSALCKDCKAGNNGAIKARVAVEKAEPVKVWNPKTRKGNGGYRRNNVDWTLEPASNSQRQRILKVAAQRKINATDMRGIEVTCANPATTGGDARELYNWVKAQPKA